MKTGMTSGKFKEKNNSHSRRPLLGQSDNGSSSKGTSLGPTDECASSQRTSLGPTDDDSHRIPTSVHGVGKGVIDVKDFTLGQPNYSGAYLFDRINHSFIKHTSIMIASINQSMPQFSNPLKLGGNLPKQKTALHRYLQVGDGANQILSESIQK